MPSVGSLIGTGIAFGCVHVLTGPDHLSALATLSANVGTCQAFSLGVRWGLGHSTGLVIVGGIMIAISSGDTVDVPHTVTNVFESLVGVFMLMLGSIGMMRACRKRPPSSVNTASVGDGDATLQMDELPLTGGSTTSIEKGEASMSISDVGQTSDGTTRSNYDTVELESGQTAPGGRVFRTACTRCIQNLSSKMLACFIGIIHGVAGPGGVLGVIPAVQLRDWRYSCIYLGSFCISSTLVMGCFAAFYGTCSRKLGKDRGQRGEYVMECISASLSLIVGILWLTLLACGKLEDVFP